MHHRRGRGPWGLHGGVGRGWYDRRNVLERLEGYQRDLEQELADVSELIRRLRDGDAPAAAAQPPAA